MNLHLIQADNAIRQDILIHNEDELIHAMNHFELRGGGGTDFRPAFEYVNQLCAEKKFSNLRGLLYFTDGMGTYPAKRPAYDTAFLFLGERFDDANVPPWAMKVVLDEEEFTGACWRWLCSRVSARFRNCFSEFRRTSALMPAKESFSTSSARRSIWVLSSARSCQERDSASRRTERSRYRSSRTSSATQAISSKKARNQGKNGEIIRKK